MLNKHQVKNIILKKNKSYYDLFYQFKNTLDFIFLYNYFF